MASVPRPMLDAGSIEQAVQTLQQRIDLLQQSLTQQQRLATLGMVTAVIAHEFNNILTPMINYTRFALTGPADPALRDKALSKALAGAERLATISESLLGFARGDQSTTAQVSHAVQETLSCLSRDLGRDGITLKIETPDDLYVAMNCGQLQQVLMNLVVNARTAMLEQAGGLRRLAITAQKIKRGKIIQIAVADTGPGIPAAVLPRIFEPFFSTKERSKAPWTEGESVERRREKRSNGKPPANALANTPDTRPYPRAVNSEPIETPAPHPAEGAPRGGTGLGLTICQELVTCAGGAMRVESELGKGSTFFIELPFAEPAPETPRPESANPNEKLPANPSQRPAPEA